MRLQVGRIIRETLVGCLLLAVCVRAASAGIDPPASQPSNSTEPPAPKLISLHVTTTDVADVLGQISAQTGFTVAVMPGYPLTPPQPIVFDVDRQPFWTVMASLRDQADGCFAFGNFGDEIVLADKRIRSETLVTKHRDTDGVMALQVERIVHTRSLGGHQGSNEYCALEMSAAREPDVLPITFCTLCIPDVAVDENGLSLKPQPGVNLFDDKQSPEYFGLPDHFKVGGIFSPQMDFSIPLATPPGAGHRIALLKGKFVYWISTRADDLEIRGDEHIDETPRRLSDGSVIKLFRRQLTGEFRIGIVIAREGMDAAAWGRQRAMLDNMRFKTRDGDGTHPLRPSNMTWNGQEETVIYGVKSDPALTTVSIHFPLAPRKVEQPFEFRDLMLP